MADRIYYENALTEEEAKGKWCPMSRRPGHYEANRLSDTGPEPTCIASRCMMWRWHDHEADKPQVGSCGLTQR